MHRTGRFCLKMRQKRCSKHFSYLMIQMMASYMWVAPDAQITYDLYRKRCPLLRKFNELFEKGQKEQPMQWQGFEGATTGPPGIQPQNEYMFCGQCGKKNAHSVRFCTDCGVKMES